MHSEILTIIKKCVKRVLTIRKAGKHENVLHPIDKENFPFQTYYVNHKIIIKSQNIQSWPKRWVHRSKMCGDGEGPKQIQTSVDLMKK